MTDTQDSRPAILDAASSERPPAGADPLGGQPPRDIHFRPAAEGDTSPQASVTPISNPEAPAGSKTAQPATLRSASNHESLAGHKNGRGQSTSDTQCFPAPADSIPAGQPATDSQPSSTCGEQVPPAGASPFTPTKDAAPRLADYQYALLSMAAKEVDDLESARVAAENRLRQTIRTVADKDGEKRGFGLLPPNVCAEDDKKAIQKVIAAAKDTKCPPDGWHPGVWQLATIAARITEAEKMAIRHLEKQVKALPLGPWLAAQAGVGDKQAGRLLGAIGDPYIRPAIEHDDAPTEPARPRILSELFSYCGHGDPTRKPFSGMTQAEAKRLGNPEAKKRVRVIAMKAIQFNGEPDKNGNPRPRSPYRDVYEKAREQYATATHASECMNRSRINPNGCGIRAHPEWGEPGSPWRDGHQHQAALRLTGKAFLADLWAEAKRIHETCASGQRCRDDQTTLAAGALNPDGAP